MDEQKAYKLINNNAVGICMNYSVALFQWAVPSVTIQFLILSVWFTYSQSITKVVQAVPHNDHPGKGGDTCILKMLDSIRVCMSVCVSVGMMVLRMMMMQNMVVVVVMVVLLVWLANSIMEVGVALVLTIFIWVATLR